VPVKTVQNLAKNLAVAEIASESVDSSGSGKDEKFTDVT
jgi:hypothetical protein